MIEIVEIINSLLESFYTSNRDNVKVEVPIVLLDQSNNTVLSSTLFPYSEIVKCIHTSYLISYFRQNAHYFFDLIILINSYYLAFHSYYLAFLSEVPFQTEGRSIDIYEFVPDLSFLRSNAISQSMITIEGEIGKGLASIQHYCHH
jgi:hypothetical protein